MNCIFCDIINKIAPASFVLENDKAIAIMDIKPITQGHILIIPKEHHPNFSELPTDTISSMFILAKYISSGLKQTDIPCDGINLFLAEGEMAGQDVMHAHLHILPRIKGDELGLKLPKQQYFQEALIQGHDLDLGADAAKIAISI